MGLVSLRFHASPSHLRTARLVAVTVARRAGFDEVEVEAVRQAIGEACALCVGGGDDVEVTLTLDDTAEAAVRLVARVAPIDLREGADATPLGLAVLAELTDHYAFEETGAGSALRLTWHDRHPA
jgi:hypothetical protein